MKLDSAVKIKAQRLKRNQREKRPAKAPRLEPTPEQQERNDFVSAGIAYRKTAVIDTMLKKGQITQAEHDKLSYYRGQAGIADTSPVRSNCDFSPRGSGEGPGAAIISAKLETDRMERDMGSLYPIVRAVAVDDVTLSGWIDQRGKVATTRRIDFALLDFRFGVGRIVIL